MSIVLAAALNGDFSVDLTPIQRAALESGSVAGLSEADREAVNAYCVETGTTNRARWRKIAPDARWQTRHKLARQWMLESQATAVVDFGSHAQTLERELPPGARYIPVDCVGGDEIDPTSSLTKTQRDRVIVVDLNMTEMPNFDADTCTFLGVLEYLLNPERAIESASTQFKSVIVSYNICKAPSQIPGRIKEGWVSHLTREEIEEVFVRAGFSIQAAVPANTRQMMWHLVRSHDPK